MLRITIGFLINQLDYIDFEPNCRTVTIENGSFFILWHYVGLLSWVNAHPFCHMYWNFLIEQ